MSNKRVLVVSHAHPDFSKGGAEVAAYNLFNAMPDVPGWGSHFLARHALPGLQRPDAMAISHNGGKETLFAGETDHFNFGVTNPQRVLPWFRSFLRGIKPDVVHFHHFWQVGLELLAEVKRYSPNTAVVVTLHEFLAICTQHGQMLKTSGQLCRKSSPAECHACLPERPQRAYFLRKRQLETFFHYVDHFISPSEFLRERFIDWGIPADRISVIENGLPMHGYEARPDVAPLEDGHVMRFGYFGQINPFKGIDVLLAAAALLPKPIQKRISIEIHGGGLEHQPPDFKQKIEHLFDDAPKCVRYYGPYSQDDLPSIMGAVDWVIMPSIWWENSPVVIQESFKFGKPLITADIGGMAEKVKNGVTGLHFRARNAVDLARVIQRAASEPALWHELQGNINPPLSGTDCAKLHVDVYDAILKRIASPAEIV